MIANLSQTIRANMDAKSTEELLELWRRHDTGVWTAEALDAAGQVLLQRGQSLPFIEARAPGASAAFAQAPATPRSGKDRFFTSVRLIFRSAFTGEPLGELEAKASEAAGECPKCRKTRPPGAPACVCGHVFAVPATTKSVSRRIFEVQLPSGERAVYEDVAILRQHILDGRFPRQAQARSRIETPAEQNKGAAGKKEAPWSTLEKLATSDFSLHSLYMPVWAHTMRFLAIGALVGIALKALDTTVLFFRIKPDVAYLWLLVLGSLAVSKWLPWVPLVMMFITARSGVNLWIALLGVMFAGALFGAPAGMLGGTVVGHFKQAGLPKAPDALPEGSRPYVVGLAAPLAFLVVGLPAYLFCLSPWAFDWIAKHAK